MASRLLYYKGILSTEKNNSINSGKINMKQEISLKKIFGGSQILTINATKFAGLDEGATPLGPYSATRGFTW